MQDKVVIRTFNAGHEAELAAGYLRELGFSARADEHLLTDINPLLSHALGGVKLYVPAEEASDARAALDELAEAPQPLVDSDDAARSPDAEEAVEPEVGADDAKARRARNMAIVGLILLPPLLHVWSISLCAEIDGSHLSPRGRLMRTVALALDAVVIVAMACFFFLL